VSRKTGAEREKYNRLSEGTRVLLELWNTSQPSADSLGMVARHPERTTLLRQLVRAARIHGWPAGALERRLDHFLREDARVAEAVEAFRAADGMQIGRLAEESQFDAEALLGNQIPETIALAHSARERGAFASCSFGAGFGGSVWALVDREGGDDFARRWHSEAFVASPGPPLVEL
jgi:galactokinase